MSAACGDGAGAGRGWGRALAGALTAAPAAALHAEPYVLFSTDKKSLLCIRCFRDMQGWVEGAGGEGLASVPERGSRAGSLQGEPRPLRGPRVSLRPGLREAAAGGAGERGLPGAPRPGLGTRAPRRLRPPYGPSGQWVVLWVELCPPTPTNVYTPVPCLEIGSLKRYLS